MSANLYDELQRVNYFNGQRLAAADFRAEQTYHMGMRRVLNRSLYSPGIVVGLEVELAKSNPPDPVDKHLVIVRHGLAFDNLGREIFIPVDVVVQVMGAPSNTPGIVFGNLLVVSYREMRKFSVQSNCMIGAPYKPCSGDLAWGAPTRIVADAVFEFLDSWPSDDSGKIVLGQIELNTKCEVVRVMPGVRRYAVPVKPQTVRALTLEGEKDIDQANPKVLWFHVDGGAPESVVLYLRARKFSSLYYTEIGKHGHNITTVAASSTNDYAHSHPVTGGKTTKNGLHKHAIWVNDGKDAAGVDVDTGDDWNNKIISDSGDHEHDLKDITLGNGLGSVTHSHVINASATDSGVDDFEVRKPIALATKTFALSFVKSLEVWLDGQDITTLIRQQLEAKPGKAGKWASLGDGTASHEIATAEGTGEIDLLKLGKEIGLGSHKLEFRVTSAGIGGAIQYNLYVS